MKRIVNQQNDLKRNLLRLAPKFLFKQKNSKFYIFSLTHIFSDLSLSKGSFKIKKRKEFNKNFLIKSFFDNNFIVF